MNAKRNKDWRNKHCEKCGNLFVAETTRQSWCSDCLTVQCSICGKSFRSIRSKIEKGLVKYCSKQCRIEADRKRTFQLVCQKCGTEFKSKSRNAEWCEACCTVKCAYCGNRVRKKRYEIESDHAVYCSVECQKKGQSSYVWTEEEKKFIADNYSTLSVNDICKGFNVGRGAVWRVIKELGLSNTPEECALKSGNSRRVWTEKSVRNKIREIAKTRRVTYTYIRREHYGLLIAATKLFGGWANAVETAALDYSAHRYSTRKCRNCGKTFDSSGHIWCQECRTITCEICGKKRVTSIGVIKAGTARYCSLKCKHKGLKFEFEKVCTNCGNIFIANSVNTVRCDECCTYKCLICGKKTRVKPSQLDTAKYCSKECRSKADMSHIWKDEDLKFIKANYPFKVSMKELADKFNTSISAINRITAKVGCQKCPIELRNLRSGASRRIWNEETVIERICELALEGPINSAHIGEHYGSLQAAACQIFGKWKNAVEAAGFRYDEINLYSNRVTWTRELIVEKILDLHNKDVNLKASYIRDNFSRLLTAARREASLGSWETAIEAAGLNYREICGVRFGTKHYGKDGFLYHSELEGKVGDLLFELQGEGSILGYENQVRVKPDRFWTCDFVVTLNSELELWLEVDGLGESRAEGAYGPGFEKIDYYLENEFPLEIVSSVNEAEKLLIEYCAN